MSQKSFVYDPETKEFRPPDLDKKPDPRTHNQAASSRNPAVRKPDAADDLLVASD